MSIDSIPSRQATPPYKRLVNHLAQTRPPQPPQPMSPHPPQQQSIKPRQQSIKQQSIQEQPFQQQPNQEWRKFLNTIQ
jgi:hypothetical protein